MRKKSFFAARLASLIICLFFVVLAVSFCGAEKVPNSAWQDGTLDAMTAEVRDRGGLVYNNAVIPMDGTLTHFTLRGQQFIYHADRGTIPRDKPLPVTIHTKVQFAVVGSTVYLRDEQGKVHRLVYVSKELPVEK